MAKTGKTKQETVENHVAETMGTVEIQKKGEEAQITEESQGVEVFKTTPAVVTLRKGRTVNMGNFESIRVEIGISVPCYREQIDDAYSLAETWTDERMGLTLKEISEGKSSKKHTKPVDF